ncbi:hypothetical protein EVAR_64362_1 [Eumeta japonica]|uniref:HAT C-terminal dimerisation domain-containing protein n=1 Tax=Eumeta variegata TaxID=151549 RepID=A0A4C1ZNN5_EUMVA|nr:hypothetical protein EVAR_64362_1 [Eumeta japonica]
MDAQRWLKKLPDLLIRRIRRQKRGQWTIPDCPVRSDHNQSMTTRTTGENLHWHISQTTFIFALCIIDKYNSMMQPVTNILQSKTLYMLRCAEHIQTITTAVAEHRRSAEEESEDLIKSAEKIATALNTELRLPRIASRQQHRANQPAASFSEYFRRSLWVPYLDSLSSLLEARFSNYHSPAFIISLLHPTQVKIALEILLAMLCSTATIERSFSTLRRVKTWLRSTMTEDKLNGLCMLNVHRKLLKRAENDQFLPGGQELLNCCPATVALV